MDCIVWLVNETNRLLQYLDEEDRWYESFEADDKEDFLIEGGKVFLEQREIPSLRASDLLEELQPAEMAMQHESSFVNASSLLAEEVLKVAEKQFVLVNKEREHATEENHRSSDEPLSDKDYDELNSFGSHREAYRNLKYNFFPARCEKTKPAFNPKSIRTEKRQVHSRGKCMPLDFGKPR